jgi:hypothetical protein
LLVFAAIATSSCRGKDAGPAAPDPAEQARRAARSFVHCVEQSGSSCVGSSTKQGAFGSLSALLWLHRASPLSLITAAEGVIQNRQDVEKNQTRFVGHLKGLYAQIRGASCEPVDMRPVDEIADALKRETQTRFDALDIWPEQRHELIDTLHSEIVAGLPNGYVAAVACAESPWLFYLVTAVDEERQTVVGFTRMMAESMRGAVEPEIVAQCEADLDAQSKRSSDFFRAPAGQVHPWIKVAMEEI